MDLTPGILHAEHPGEKDYLDGGEDNQAERSSPEIKLIHDAVFEEKYGRMA